MDPFGDDTAAETDLSSFQPPADNAAYNGDFYEVEPVQDGDAPAEASYDANDDVFGESAAAAPVQEEQQQYMSYEETTTTASYQSETVQESYSYASYDAPAPVETAPQIPVIEEDNELTKFMREYELKIAEKAAEQEKVAVECKQKAETDMQQFVTERSRIKESKQQSNRVHEQATLEKLAADLENDNPWERVVSLVDMESNRKQKLAALKKEGKVKEPTPAPAPVKASAKKEEEEDISRMRQLFLQLKTEPLEKTRGISAH